MTPESLKQADTNPFPIPVRDIDQGFLPLGVYAERPRGLMIIETIKHYSGHPAIEADIEAFYRMPGYTNEKGEVISPKNPYKILSDPEVTSLFADIDQGLKVYEDSLGHGSLNPEEDRALLKVAKAHETLYRCNLGLVKRLSAGHRKFVSQSIDMDDLEQEASMALGRAIREYDVGLGAKFSGFAGNRIKMRLIETYKNQSRTIRIPLRRWGLLIEISKTKDPLEANLGRSPTPEEIADATQSKVDHVLQVLPFVDNQLLSLDKEIGLGDEKGALLETLPGDPGENPANTTDLMHASLVTDLILRGKIVGEESISARTKAFLCLRYGINDPDTFKALEAVPGLNIRAYLQAWRLSLSSSGLDQVEIASLTGLSIDTVKDAIRKALKKLKETLDKG